MRAPQALSVLLLLASVCLAQQGSSPDPPAEANGVQCAQSGMQAARQALEDADRLFGSGDVRAAHDAIDLALHQVRRSVDCALQARKSERSAEIDLRQLIRRMKDILQTIDSEDRPHLSRSLIELEKQRDRLLRAIFGPAAGSSAQEKKP